MGYEVNVQYVSGSERHDPLYRRPSKGKDDVPDAVKDSADPTRRIEKDEKTEQTRRPANLPPRTLNGSRFRF